jgi:hypothetical protein
MPRDCGTGGVESADDGEISQMGDGCKEERSRSVDKSPEISKTLEFCGSSSSSSKSSTFRSNINRSSSPGTANRSLWAVDGWDELREEMQTVGSISSSETFATKAIR